MSGNPAKTSKMELLTAPPGKLFVRYLVPSVAATMMVALNYFIDTLCVGQAVGEMGLAALNIAQPAPNILYGLGALLGIGGSTLYSANMGKGKVKKARAIYNTCLITILVVTVAIMVLGMIFLQPIATFMGGVGSVRAGVIEYLTYVFLFAPCFALDVFLSAFLRNDNAPRLSMIATVTGAVLNIILDVLFLFGFGWGIWGASLATSIAIAVSVVMLVASTFRKKSGLKLAPRTWAFPHLKSATKLGVPSFLTDLTGVVVTLAFNSVLLRISGETAVAVYGMIASMTLVVASGVSGVSSAMQPLVSVNAGAGRQMRVSSFMRMAVISSFGLSLFFVLLGEIWPRWLIRVFLTADANFTAMAIPGIRIVFISYLIMSANVLIAVYFQSVQFPGEAFLLTLMRGVVLPVVLVMGFAVFMGVTGVWVSTIAAELCALLLGLVLYSRVRGRLREKNYAQLRYFVRRKDQQTLDEILEELGAEEMVSFMEVIERYNAIDESYQGIPAFIGLEDLTTEDEGAYAPAYDDEDMGLTLAVGSLLFAELFEQNDEYMRDKQREEDWPAAAPALDALAMKCFRFEYDEEEDDTTIIGYPVFTPEGEVLQMEDTP